MGLRMVFDPLSYGDAVSSILKIGGDGSRLMPLVFGECSPGEAKRLLTGANPSALFPGALAAPEALAGLWLYFDCFEESHRISQDLDTPEAIYWHAILHRREPDPGNAGYWFHRLPRHPVYEELAESTAELQKSSGNALLDVAQGWDSLAFVDLVETARKQPGSDSELFARRIQLLEWQLLFDYCARPAR